MSYMFNEERVAQILSLDFPSKDILDKLVIAYKEDIRSSFVDTMGTEAIITTVQHHMFRIFHREDIMKQLYPKEA